jgi:hypothetical protein
MPTDTVPTDTVLTDTVLTDTVATITLSETECCSQQPIRLNFAASRAFLNIHP